MVRRRHVLGGSMVLVAVATALLLWEVAATVFFALTVAYVLSPVRRSLRRRGLSRRLSAGIATFAGFLGVLVLVSPLGIILFLRIESVIAFLQQVPDTVPIAMGGWSTTIVVDDVIVQVTDWLMATATTVAAAMPVLFIKLGLFTFVVYSVLYYEQRTRRAIVALVPPAHRDLADALHRRARRTLYGIYVVQAATGLGTVLIAFPVFIAFGYPSPLALATVAGILQFVPVLGPSLLIGALAVSHVIVGDIVLAITILAVGGFLIAWIPDLVIRPRLAAETANLPSSLYFIGFVGGVLTVGPIGVIAGPLVVAILAELATQLAEEFNRLPVSERL